MNQTINPPKKSNSELLKEVQGIADAIDKTKKEVEGLLIVIDNLEKQYFEKTQEIRDINKKK